MQRYTSQLAKPLALGVLLTGNNPAVLVLCDRAFVFESHDRPIWDVLLVRKLRASGHEEFALKIF